MKKQPEENNFFAKTVFLKKYKVESILGKGAFARVYRVYDFERKTFSALKIVNYFVCHLT